MRGLTGPSRTPNKGCAWIHTPHAQIIANTGGILGMGYTPHEVIARPGRATVDVDQLPFRGPRTPEAKWHKVGVWVWRG
jgi:hypothetical protein